MKFKTMMIESKKSAIQKYGDELDEDHLEELIEMDPSPNFKYVEFLCRMAVEGIDITQDEIDTFYDRDQKNWVSPGLLNTMTYAKFKRSLTFKDSFAKDIGKLETRINKSGIEPIWTSPDGEIKVFNPKNHAESVQCGNENWCTARKNDDSPWLFYKGGNPYNMSIDIFYILDTNPSSPELSHTALSLNSQYKLSRMNDNQFAQMQSQLEKHQQPGGAISPYDPREHTEPMEIMDKGLTVDDLKLSQYFVESYDANNNMMRTRGYIYGLRNNYGRDIEAAIHAELGVE